MLSSKLQFSSRDRKIFGIFLIIIIASVGFTAFYSYNAGVKAQSSALTMQTHSGGPQPGAPSYTIFTDDGTYYAKDAYGAITSSTNAASLINSIISSLTTGGQIYLKVGQYTITQRITLLSGVSIIGEILTENWISTMSGKGVNLIASASLNDHVFFADHVYNVVLKNIAINMDALTGSYDAMHFLGFSYGDLENIVVNHASRDGLHINSSLTEPSHIVSQVNRFEYININGASRYAAYLNHVHDGTVDFLELTNPSSSDTALYWLNSGDMTLNHVKVFASGGTGATFENIFKFTITDMQADSNDYIGIYLNAVYETSFLGGWSVDNGVVGSAFGMYILNSKNNTIVGMGFIESNPTSQTVGIRMDGTTDALSVIGCNFNGYGGRITTPISNVYALNQTVYSGNIGFVTHTFGYANITDGSQISHGLSGTPTSITIGNAMMASETIMAAYGATSTIFYVSFRPSPSGYYQVYWSADYKP